MDEIINLHSRRGSKNYLQKMTPKDPNRESKTYVLKSSESTLRAGYTEDKQYFIDPSGGPMIVVGNLLEEANAIVKSIDHIYNYGFTITFE